MTDLLEKLRTLNERSPTLQVERFFDKADYERLADLIVIQPVTPVGVAWIRIRELVGETCES